MIGIRADANSIIATGHVMRCLTIAKALMDMGEEVTFFIADEESKRLLCADPRANKLNVVVLGSDYQDMEGEVEALEKELKARNITMLLVDSYSVTISYFEKLKIICRVAYLDDLNKETYPVDMLINYSGYASNMGYEEAYAGSKDVFGKSTRLLLGLNYAPLREQFYQEGPSDKNCDTMNILLSTGGADTCGMLMPILKETDKNGLFENAIWHVVVGDYVSNPEDISSFAGKREAVVIHKSVKNMAELMNKCQLAVIAAGTMLTECAALRLPALFYQIADNQKINVLYWSKVSGMTFAGNVLEEGKDAVITNICDNVKELTSSMDKLEKMSQSLASITDGRGAIRIAKALIEEK